MTEATVLAKFAVSMIAVVNPLGMTPMFLGLTASQDAKEKRRTARRAALTVMAALAAVSIIGGGILTVFGISVASFRVIGGVLFLLMAIDMLRAQPRRTNQTPEEKEEAQEMDDIAIVPLGVPILAGPGAISSVLIFAEENGDVQNRLWLLAIILGVSVAVWLVLLLAEPIGKALGKTGTNIMTRAMGLVVGAMAIEYIGSGMAQIWPALAS